MKFLHLFHKEEGLVEQEDEGLSQEQRRLNRQLKKEERSEMLAGLGLEEVVEGEQDADW